jgi:hypothetical protein
MQKKIEKERLEKERMEKERERERQAELHAGTVGSVRGGVEQQVHEEERSVCKVCFESPTAAVLLPCRHFCCKLCFFPL